METEPLEAATEPAEPVSKARPFWRTRRAILLGGILAAAVAVVAAIAVFPRVVEPDTVRTVRAFLTAVRQKDPDRAFEIAGVSTPPSGDLALFLTADAISDDWQIGAIDELYQGGDTAEVRVTIAGPDDRTATTTMDLSRAGDGGWTIDEPFVRVRIESGPLWYAEVNGVRTPAEVHEFGVEAYPLLPGFYRFYTELPAGFQARFEDLLALPDTYSQYPASIVGDVALDAAGEQAVQRAVDAYIDGCAQRADLDPGGCPFGTDPVTGPELPEYGILYDIESVRWRVVEYPIVAAVPSRNGLAITDRRRGVVELRAAGHDLDFTGGVETDLGLVEFTVECEMITSRLVAGLAANGRVTVVPVQGPGDTWDTCGFPLSAETG